MVNKRPSNKIKMTSSKTTAMFKLTNQNTIQKWNFVLVSHHITTESCFDAPSATLKCSSLRRLHRHYVQFYHFEADANYNGWRMEWITDEQQSIKPRYL